MKGIVLAGGTGSRLSPLTTSVSKQLLPIYNKPMIYYSLATLMLAGLQETLVICTPEHLGAFKKLLGDGSQFGIELTYEVQHEPKGIAECFTLGENFIGNESVGLVLGDNLFHGIGLGRNLMQVVNSSDANIFAYQVENPREYGVVEFDNNGIAITLEEKPISPKSNFAVPGLYFYPNDVVEIAKSIEPSERGELEITTINQAYLNSGRLKVTKLDRGTVWLDTGSFIDLHNASEYVKLVELRQGLQIACLEEIAIRKGWIGLDSTITLLRSQSRMSTAQYLEKVFLGV